MLVADASPLLALTVGVVAALPAYALTHRSGRGRARGSIAYLSGLFVGTLAAVALFQIQQMLAPNPASGGAALTGAFFGPFAGLLWGRRARTGRRKSRRVA